MSEGITESTDREKAELRQLEKGSLAIIQEFSFIFLDKIWNHIGCAWLNLFWGWLVIMLFGASWPRKVWSINSEAVPYCLQLTQIWMSFGSEVPFLVIWQDKEWSNQHHCTLIISYEGLKFRESFPKKLGGKRGKWGSHLSQYHADCFKRSSLSSSAAWLPLHPHITLHTSTCSHRYKWK